MNRKHVISMAAVALLVGACAQAPKDHFVVRGVVPGAMDSTEVDIRGEGIKPVEGYIIDEKFELRGEARVPVLCRLSINNQKVADRKGVKEEEQAVKYVEANVFVENGDLVFSTPHIDSLPQSFWRYDIRRENNYTLKGSPTHDAFDRFRRQTMELQAEIRRLEWLKERTPEEVATLDALQQKYREASRNYIASQRNLALNLHLAEVLEREPFTYDQAYLDGVTALFAGYTDTTAALRAFRESYREAAAYVQGTPFAGGVAYSLNNDTTDLKGVIKAGRYALFDFWASWCGPCRASFPHLRKMYEIYGEKVDFYSVSVDKKDNEWRQAVEEEKLPWPQYCATPDFRRAMNRYYRLTSVPTFLLVDPAGKIIFSGHNGTDLEASLSAL